MSVTDRLQVLSVSMREAGKYEIMHNSKGQPYKVVYRDFIRWVTKEFGGGAKAGPYLRDEEPIPDHLLGRLRDEIGATGKGIPGSLEAPDASAGRTSASCGRGFAKPCGRWVSVRVTSATS